MHNMKYKQNMIEKIARIFHLPIKPPRYALGPDSYAAHKRDGCQGGQNGILIIIPIPITICWNYAYELWNM